MKIYQKLIMFIGVWCLKLVRRAMANHMHSEMLIIGPVIAWRSPKTKVCVRTFAFHPQRQEAGLESKTDDFLSCSQLADELEGE